MWQRWILFYFFRWRLFEAVDNLIEFIGHEMWLVRYSCRVFILFKGRLDDGTISALYDVSVVNERQIHVWRLVYFVFFFIGASNNSAINWICFRFYQTSNDMHTNHSSAVGQLYASYVWKIALNRLNRATLSRPNNRINSCIDLFVICATTFMRLRQ